MTVEQLLIPRFKMIADFPFSERDRHNVGDIYTDNGKTAVLNQKKEPVRALDWLKYPHLFKPLQWSEDRDVNDMPKYVKYESTTTQKFKVWMVSDWSESQGRFWFKYNGCQCELESYFFPATEQEYNDYLTTQTTHG